MLCENCNNNHDGSYASGRFCSAICARSFSSKIKRSETNKKVSEALKGRKTHDHGFKKGYDPRRKIFTDQDRERALQTLAKTLKERYDNSSFEELSLKLKKRRVLEEQDGVCFICGIAQWLERSLTLELHHINGDDSDNTRDNLQVLCPNCHSQTSNFRKKSCPPVAQLADASGLDPEGTSSSLVGRTN